MIVVSRDFRLLHLVLVLSLFLGFFAGYMFLKPAEAHPIGWYWDVANIQIKVKNNTSSYGVQISSATSDYNNNTDLSAQTSTSSCTICHAQGNWGMSGWVARALPYSYRTICVNAATGVPTGYCNTTNHKVSLGHVQWNDYYGTSRPHFIARHEMGHLFGLAHTNCSYSSVMQGVVCNPYPAALTGHDRADINAMY